MRTDNSAGNLIGFTSAHCGGPGAPVAGVGTVLDTNDALDYAVIKFNPNQVTPIANVDGFAINGINLNPGFGQWSCKQSATNGQSCFALRGWALDRSIYTGRIPWQPGDNGAPVTADGLLIGMVRDGSVTELSVPPTRPEILKLSSLLDDVNAKGGPGAGFSPIPG